MDALQIVAIWLHTVAFVIAWGYYGILGRMILPGLERAFDGASTAEALVAIERRALPLIGISVVLFVATGVYLLVIDPEYRGLGNVLASTWTVLMTAKHVLVGLLVVDGVAVDGLIRRLARAATPGERRVTLRWLRLSVEGATALGALIALLTVIAQAA